MMFVEKSWWLSIAKRTKASSRTYVNRFTVKTDGTDIKRYVVQKSHTKPIHFFLEEAANNLGKCFCQFLLFRFYS